MRWTAVTTVSVLFALASICRGQLAPQDAYQRASEQLNSGDAAEVEQALIAIPSLLAKDPYKANSALKDAWIPALMKQKQYGRVEDLALAAIRRSPSDSGMIEILQTQRVRAALADGKAAEALAQAKALYNVASMGATSNALAVFSECLEAAHPGDNQLLTRFKFEQISGASTQPSAAPAAAQVSVLSTVKVEAAVYEQRINELPKVDYNALVGKGNLLLLAGRAKEAREAFDRAYELAPDDQLRTATENIAKAIKAEDGTIGRANKFVLALRPRK